jgi:cell wall-associated NlpC family hydrolase
MVCSLALALAGCFSRETLPDPGARPVTAAELTADPRRLRVVFTALQQIGVPYRWGGSSPQGFDCSGLVLYSFNSIDRPLPRTAADQMTASRPVALADALPGDLLFFRQGGRTSHVGIYLGQSRFVHAPNTGGNVRIDHLGMSYWRRSFARAGRFIAD